MDALADGPSSPTRSVGAQQPVMPIARTIVALATLSLSFSAALAQQVDTTLWGTDGSVGAIACSGNRVYIGGGFSVVAPMTGGSAILDTRRGGVLATSPRVTGHVFAAAADGSGGWFIGGDFTSVGGVLRTNLAHVLADGRIADWNPRPDYSVSVIAVRGQKVYIGGPFTTVNHVSRSGLAVLDAQTGAVDPWDPKIGGTVTAMTFRGSALYFGGLFRSVAGQPRSCLAAVNVENGALMAFDPNASDAPWGMTVNGGTVYVVGRSMTFAGERRGGLAALDAATGELSAWNPSPTYGGYQDGPLLGVVAKGNMVFVIGYFTDIGGKEREGIAAVDASTGKALDWNVAGSGPWSFVNTRALALQGNTLYVGGEFSVLGGRARNRVAAFDAFTGDATDWDPEANSTVTTIAASEQSVFVSGNFTAIGGKVRRNLAALDATTGAVTDWDAAPNGEIDALLVSGDTLFAGGGFTTIGGQSRTAIAALDRVTGRATGWDAKFADGSVYSIARQGPRLYVGGSFTSVAGQSRMSLAALDAATGVVSGWNPRAYRAWHGGSRTPAIYSLATNGGVVYATGVFDSIGGQPRPGLAALDAISGADTGWMPEWGYECYTLLAAGGRVYAGTFYRLYGMDASSGAIVWNPNPDNHVFALALDGNTIYAGGYFSVIGGKVRPSLAALDVTTAGALDWQPGVGGYVYALTIAGERLYVGGSFSSMGGILHSNVAWVSLAGAIPSRVAGVSYAAVPTPELSVTNPVRGSASIRFTLPRAGPVSLAVFDLQGRRVSRLIDHAQLGAGRHEVEVNTAIWPPGLYMLRVESLGKVIVRKMAVVR
jgi:hypothetical protein